MYKGLELNPDIQFVDGKVTEASVDSVVQEAQIAITELDKVIGTDTSSFVSSVIPMLRASNTELIPHVGYGILINGCGDMFTVDGVKYQLSLVPSTPNALTFSSGTFTYSPTDVFTSASEYTVIGRTVVFAQEPASASLTITYNGYVPEDYGAHINHQTLYPNPENIALSRVDPPVVTVIDALTNVYGITVPNETFLGGVDEEFASPIPNSIPSILSSYVSSGGAIETPLDFASLWVLSAGKYNKVPLVYFKILSANAFVVRTEAPITITDTFVISLFSKSLPELVNELYVAYKNHNHDGYGNTEKLSHENIESDPAKDYHSQYLRKEGYSNVRKDNRMSGDLFLASTDATSDNSNTINKSNMVIFGDYAFGHVMYRETGEFGYIRLDARSSNGINILLETPSEGAAGKSILKSGDTRFFNSLNMSASKTSLNIDGGDILYLLAEKNVDTEELETRLVTIKNGSMINVGGIKLVATATGAKVINDTGKQLSVEGEVLFKSGIFQGATVEELLIPETKQITFGTSGQHMVSTTEGAQFTNKVSISQYAKIAVVSEENGLPLGISNVMTVVADNSIYMLRKVVNGLSVNGVQYSFRETIANHTRIDRIQDWPKQDLFVGKAKVDELILDESDFSKRLGIKFGTTAKIYTSSNDQVCSMDSLIIESKDEAVFLRIGDTSSDCSNKDFLGVKMGALQVNGDASVTGDAIVDGNISAVNISIEGDFKAGGNMIADKTITAGAIKSTGALTVAGNTSLQDVNVAGTLTITSLQVGGNAIVSGDLGIGKSVAISGMLQVGRNAQFETSITVGDRVEATRVVAELGKFVDLAVAGDANISGRVVATTGDFNGNVSSGGTITSEAGVFKQSITTKNLVADSITTSRLSVEGRSSLKDTDVSGKLTVLEQFNVGGKTSLFGGATVDEGLKVLGGAAISEGLTVSGGIDASGELKVSGNTAITGTLTAGPTNVNGNVVIEGSLSVEKGLAVIKNLEVLARAEFNVIGANVVYLGSALIGDSGTQATVGNINCANMVIAPRGTDSGDKLLAYVNIEAMKNVYVANLLEGNVIKAKSVFTLGTKEDSAPGAGDGDVVYLTTDGLHFAKENSIIGVDVIAAKKMLGRSAAEYSELASFDSSISRGLISALEASKFTIADNLSVEGILNVPRSLVVGGTVYFNKMVPLDPKQGFVDIIAGAAVYE